jgi:hypothetical protein
MDTSYPFLSISFPVALPSQHSYYLLIIIDKLLSIPLHNVSLELLKTAPSTPSRFIKLSSTYAAILLYTRKYFKLRS